MNYKAEVTAPVRGDEKDCPIVIERSAYFFDHGKPRHISITSDEQILPDDYYLTGAGVFRCSFESKRELSQFRKIVSSSDVRFELPILTKESVEGIVKKLSKLPENVWVCEVTEEEIKTV